MNPIEILIIAAARELIFGSREWWRWYAGDAGPVLIAASDVASAS